jgi:hypothetical protein
VPWADFFPHLLLQRCNLKAFGWAKLFLSSEAWSFFTPQQSKAIFLNLKAIFCLLPICPLPSSSSDFFIFGCDLSQATPSDVINCFSPPELPSYAQ